MWNFKGTLWNSTQNILPIPWKVCFSFRHENLRALRFKISSVFLKCPPGTVYSWNLINTDSANGLSLVQHLLSIWTLMKKLQWNLNQNTSRSKDLIASAPLSCQRPATDKAKLLMTFVTFTLLDLEMLCDLSSLNGLHLCQIWSVSVK